MMLGNTYLDLVSRQTAAKIFWRLVTTFLVYDAQDYIRYIKKKQSDRNARGREK